MSNTPNHRTNQLPVLFSEPECRAFSHSDFNTGFIQLIGEQFSNILICADESHCSVLKKKLATSHGYGKLGNDSGSSRETHFLEWSLTDLGLPLWKRFGKDLVSAFRLLQCAKQKSINEIYQLSSTASNLLAMKLMVRFFSGVSVHVVIHGILEELTIHKPWFRYRHPKNWYKTLFWFGNAINWFNTRKVSYIFLSPEIPTIVKKRLKRIKASYSAIHHPVIVYDDFLERSELTPKRTIDLCWVGIMNNQKGAQDYITLADKLSQDQRVFHLLGHINDPEIEINDNIVCHGDVNRFVPDDVMDAKLPLMDFTVFTYPTSSYKFTVSGALLTSLGYGVPVLAVRNPYFSCFFKDFPEAGMLFDTIDELQSFLEKPVSDLFEIQNTYSRRLKELPAKVWQYNTGVLHSL